MDARLHFRIQTPHARVFDGALRAARVPTETGQVGLRPRQEPSILVVEPGLVLLFEDGRSWFAATAGGLLEVRRQESVLFTPFAVAGDDGAAVLAALDRALAAPDAELAARRRLGELEQRIVQEVRTGPSETAPRRARRD